MKLQREGDQQMVNVDSSKIKRRKRDIRQTGMRFAAVSGNCCWEVRNQKSGGESRHLKTVESHQLPWDIKSLRLVNCVVE